MRVLGNLKSVLKLKILFDAFSMLLILTMPMISIPVAKTFKALEIFGRAGDEVRSSPESWVFLRDFFFSRWVELQSKEPQRASEGNNVSE
jgi:hypothetical protein